LLLLLLLLLLCCCLQSGLFVRQTCSFDHISYHVSFETPRTWHSCSSGGSSRSSSSLPFFFFFFCTSLRLLHSHLLAHDLHHGLSCHLHETFKSSGTRLLLVQELQGLQVLTAFGSRLVQLDDPTALASNPLHLGGRKPQLLRIHDVVHDYRSGCGWGVCWRDECCFCIC